MGGYWSQEDKVGVRLVSRFTPRALLGAQLHEVGSAGESADADVQSSAVAEATAERWDDVARGLHGETTDTRSEQEACDLVMKLPDELLGKVLAHLDFRSLLRLRETCWWACTLIFNSYSQTVQLGMLDDVTREIAALVEKEGERLLAELLYYMVLNVDHHAVENVRKMLAIAVLGKSLMSHKPAVPNEARDVLTQMVHPKVRSWKAYPWVRSFVVPRALYILKEHTEEVLLRSLNDAALARCMLNSKGELIVDAKFVPVTSLEELDSILKERKMRCRVPSGHEVLRAFGRVVGSDEVMLWRDVDTRCMPFDEGRFRGFQFVVMGPDYGAVVRWNYDLEIKYD